jgi:prepilin-type N-terminal cleavage/methylation domain-containing protein
MKHDKHKRDAGFSLMELMIAMAMILVLMGIVSTVLSKSLSVRQRESRKADALTSAQAALNLMSREIANSGFGIYDGPPTEKPNNGIILGGESNDQQIHFRANLTNFGPGPVNPTCPAVCTSDPGEDVTYYFDNTTRSIVRFDRYANPQKAVVVNRISNVTFRYFDYADDGTSTPEPGNSVPTAATGRIRLRVDVTMDPVVGQPTDSVTFTSEINLRNSSYMLHQY